MWRQTEQNQQLGGFENNTHNLGSNETSRALRDVVEEDGMMSRFLVEEAYRCYR